MTPHTSENDAPRVLDPASAIRMMYFDKENPDVVFGDLRRESLIVTDKSNKKGGGKREITVCPDCQMDFRALPYRDESFWLVAFDPPHLLRGTPTATSFMGAKFGRLFPSWEDDLRLGFDECFRVLRPNGTLVFKWSDVSVKLARILPLTPHKPIFGARGGYRSATHWLVFMK